MNNTLEQTGRRAECIIEEVRQTTVMIHAGSAPESDHDNTPPIRSQSLAMY